MIATPNFPAYPSGHSTAAPATAVVLGHLFPEDAEQLLLDAQENALSRLYGAIFSFELMFIQFFPSTMTKSKCYQNNKRQYVKKFT